MAKTSAPATAATQDDELPKTAVKPSRKDLYIQTMQEKLAELGNDEPPAPLEPPTDEEATWNKRYADLRRHSQKKEADLQRQVKEREDQIKQLEQVANQPMPQTKEEFEAWKAKYPDIAGFIEIIADEKATQRAGQLQTEIGTLKDKLTETEKEKAFATLKSLVPDLEEVVGSATYKEWREDQPKAIQETLAVSDDPYEIAKCINIYKAMTKSPATKTPKGDKLAALDTSVRNTGTTPSKNGGSYKYTQAQISKMGPEEYAAKEADIIEARNNGQILDDLTRRNTVFDL